MNILFITHKFPPTIGGMEKHSYELHSRLKQDHTVYDLIYDNKEGRVKFFFKLKNRAQKILQQNKDIEVIYVNDALGANVAIKLKSITTIPIVATFHGLDVVFPNSTYQNRILPKLKELDGIIAVSEATRQACLDRGFNKEKVFTVKNGVDHELGELPVKENFKSFFQKKYNLSLEGKKILVTMGRPVRRKGFSWFIENVLPKLSDDVLFILTGPRKGKESSWLKVLPKEMKNQIQLMFGLGSDEDKINALLKDSILQTSQPNRLKKAIQVGKLPFDEILQLISIADLFVMPNVKVKGDAEGFGLVALEASIRATPVVAAGIEGITDAIQDGKNGFLLPSENANAWIEKINSLLKNKEALSQFGNQAKEYTINNFSWEKMVKGYVEVFKKVIGTANPNP